MQVAIDGPAGSGKSTVCKILANNYNLIYVDTGAMYRAVAWVELQYPEVDVEDTISNVEFSLFNRGKNLSIEYRGEIYELTDEIRTPEVSERVPKTAANPIIRAALVKKQQEYAKSNNVIMEGRDITTVVLPNADVKVFLTADTQERAKRRFDELKAKSVNISFDTVLQKIIERDNADSSRATSPLTKAPDANEIDTSALSLEDVCIEIGRLIEAVRK